MKFLDSTYHIVGSSHVLFLSPKLFSFLKITKLKKSLWQIMKNDDLVSQNRISFSPQPNGVLVNAWKPTQSGERAFSCSICWCQWYKYHGPFQATNVKSASSQNFWKFNRQLWADSGTPPGLLTYLLARCLHVITKLHQGTHGPGHHARCQTLSSWTDLARADSMRVMNNRCFTYC